MKAVSFSHVALNCRSIAATEEFYSRHFNFHRARVIDLGKSQIVFLKSGSVYLELFQAEGRSPAPEATKDGPTTAGVRHLAFQVENVDAALASLGDAARPTLGPLSFDSFIPGWRTVWIRDPDGNIVEISQGFVDQTPTPTVAATFAANGNHATSAR
jgi:glyoxylase I family protein